MWLLVATAWCGGLCVDCLGCDVLSVDLTCDLLVLIRCCVYAFGCVCDCIGFFVGGLGY